MILFKTGLLALLQVAIVMGSTTGTIKDIKHVVLLMQENRAFDHYFGTMAGVRGFGDPNVQQNTYDKLTLTTFEQPVEECSQACKNIPVMTPWYAGHQGGEYVAASQCKLGSPAHDWKSLHGAYNKGKNDGWAMDNSDTLGFYKRGDIPQHFAIAEAFTVGDMYQQSVMSMTDPNRVFWTSGSINVPGGPQGPNREFGGPTLQNSDHIVGCMNKTYDGLPQDCWPLKWTTIHEHLQNAGVSWQIFQNATNQYAENIILGFANFKYANTSSPLYQHAVLKDENTSMDQFMNLAKEGNLPQVSFLIADQELSEHAPWLPRDGGWFQTQVAEAVMSGKSWEDTVVIFSYDECGGWADHVTPFVSPNGTAGEWLMDPYGEEGYTIAGPGHRLPFYILSPWTQGGNVFTEHADHSSQLMFLEQWLSASGYDVGTKEISTWRRNSMSNLVNAFDFANPNFTVPKIPSALPPSTNPDGSWNGLEVCQDTYAKKVPSAPSPIATPTSSAVASSLSKLVEVGYKPVRGLLTEGRYLVFETNGYTLIDNGGGKLGSAKINEKSKSLESARWVLTELMNDEKGVLSSGGTRFNLTNWQTKKTFENWTITLGAKNVSYSLMEAGNYLTIEADGTIEGKQVPGSAWQIFSVSYS